MRFWSKWYIILDLICDRPLWSHLINEPIAHNWQSDGCYCIYDDGYLTPPNGLVFISAAIRLSTKWHWCLISCYAYLIFQFLISRKIGMIVTACFFTTVGWLVLKFIWIVQVELEKILLVFLGYLVLLRNKQNIFPNKCELWLPSTRIETSKAKSWIPSTIFIFYIFCSEPYIGYTTWVYYFFF